MGFREAAGTLLNNQSDNKGAKKTGKKCAKKRKMLLAAVLLAAAAAIAAGIFIYRSKTKTNTSTVSRNNVSKVARGDISNDLSSSGTLAPKDTYTITSLVSGEIITADFNEGDQVTEGQTLYVIDQSDIVNDIDSAQRSLTNAQTSYDDAVKDQQDAAAKFNNGTILSTETGYIKNLELDPGDTVGGSNGSTIAQIYNDGQMNVRLAFLNNEADALVIGQDIIVELCDTGEQIPGIVKNRSDLIETLDGGVLVKYVEIYVTNPGGLTTADRAVAYMNGIYSISDGAFEPGKVYDLKVDLPSSVKVQSVLVHEGQYVGVGTPLFTITQESLDDALKTYSKSVTSAESSLHSAENQITKLDDTIEKYTITAPISGQVITKYMKAGDKINSSSNNSTSLALIYDLSELTFEMSIDELDISNVKVGQEVTVTADAFEDRTYSGYVSNVSLNGTASNGVTTYPVVVTLNETEGLLPGMNVSGVIKLEHTEDTLYIPVNALQRGNIVYVRDGSGDSAESGSSGDGESGKAKEKSESGDSARNSSVSDSDVPEGFHAVKVETGIISEDYVEILSGLSEGEEVYVKDAVVSTETMMGPGGMGQGPGGMGGGGGGSRQGGGSGGSRQGGAPGGF